MSFEFTLEADWPARFRTELAARSERISEALRASVNRAGDRARENLSGRVLRARSGRLLKSVKTGRVVRDGDLYSGRIHSRLDPFNYGAALETGFAVKAAIIRPRAKRALRFVGPSGPVFATKVNRPAFSVPPHPWLAPAASASADELEPALIEAAGMSGA